MMYETILLDLDHTLLDSDESETLAFEEMLAGFGAVSSETLLSDYRAINRRLWQAVERGELSPDVVRLERFVEFGGLHLIDADPAQMAERFAAGLKAHGSLYPGVGGVLKQLASSVRLGLVTNGLSDIQRARIERLGIEEYFEAIVVSAEVGIAKPDRDIFAIAFEQLGGPPHDTSVMVGDSLSSDMAGAAAFGIDGCWYNPEKRPRPDEPPIAHEIRSLVELPALVSSARV